jgi:hypothetical protein
VLLQFVRTSVGRSSGCGKRVGLGLAGGDGVCAKLVALAGAKSDQ